MSPLSTARLRISPFTLDDAGFIVELLNDPGWLQHIGDRKVRTLDDARRYLRDGPLASQQRHGFALWAVHRLDAAAGAAPVGMCGLIRREGLDDVDIGYAFMPAARGQGLAREAAAAVLRHGFEHLGLQRIVAITCPDNAPSVRVLESIGLRYERRLQLPGRDDESLLYAAVSVPVDPRGHRGSGFAGPQACLAGRMAARRGHSSARPSRRRPAWSRGPRPP